MPYVKPTNVNAFIDVLAARVHEAIYADSFIQNNSSTPADKAITYNQGDTMRITRDPQFTVNDAVDGSGKTYQHPVQGADTLTLREFREIPVDLSTTQNAIEISSLSVDRYANAITQALRIDVEKTLLQAILDDPTYTTANEVGAIGTALNNKAMATLGNKIKTTTGQTSLADYICILSNKHVLDLNLDTGMNADATGTANTAVTQGLLQPRFGFGTMYESALLPTNTEADSVSGTGTDIISMCYKRSNVLLAFADLKAPQDPGTISRVVRIGNFSFRIRISGNMNLNQDMAMVIDTLYGVKVLQTPITTKTNTLNPLVFPILGGVA